MAAKILIGHSKYSTPLSSMSHGSCLSHNRQEEYNSANILQSRAKPGAALQTKDGQTTTENALDSRNWSSQFTMYFESTG